MSEQHGSELDTSLVIEALIRHTTIDTEEMAERLLAESPPRLTAYQLIETAKWLDEVGGNFTKFAQMRGITE
jgi:hypothetical protein